MAGNDTAVPFSLVAGHPALDFVNTLDNRFREDGPHELLRQYADLLRFTQQSKLLTSAQSRVLARTVTGESAQRSLQAALELREATAATLYGSVVGPPPQPSDIKTLERYFLSAAGHQELRWVQSPKNSPAPGGIAWTWGRFETDAALPVWLLSAQIAGLMMSAGRDRLRTCAVDTCRWLFLDTSRNHSRRWCDMKVCGNRMKARRFNARRER